MTLKRRADTDHAAKAERQPNIRMQLALRSSLPEHSIPRGSADFWLGLQLDWDLWHLLRSRDAERIAKLSPLPRAS